MKPSRTSQGAARIAAPFAIVLALLLSSCASDSQPPVQTIRNSERSATVNQKVPAAEPAPDPAPANPSFDQNMLDELLRQAAWTNDLAAAEQLLTWGADVNQKDATEQSAYLVATSEGHLEFLRLTLTNNADVHALDSWLGTGLIRAAERGHWAVVGELIQNGVPLDHINRVGYQAIHEAVWMGRDDLTYHATTRVLFAGGADFGAPSGSEGLTPLQMAETRGFAGQADVIRALLQAPIPADPTAALLAAAESGDVTAAAVALRAGADTSATNQAGERAHAIASSQGHVLTAQLIRALDHTIDNNV